jgi:methyl-accepting chemotaxis protein
MSGVTWRMRAAMALQVAAAALLGWLGNGVFGGGLYGWLAALGLLAVVTVVLAAFLEMSVVGRLKRLQRVIATMYVDGDLTRRATVEGKDEIASLAADFNRLIGQLSRRLSAKCCSIRSRWPALPRQLIDDCQACCLGVEDSNVTRPPGDGRRHG